MVFEKMMTILVMLTMIGMVMVMMMLIMVLMVDGGADDIVDLQVWCAEDNNTCIDTLCPEGMELKVFFQMR